MNKSQKTVINDKDDRFTVYIDKRGECPKLTLTHSKGMAEYLIGDLAISDDIEPVTIHVVSSRRTTTIGFVRAFPNGDVSVYLNKVFDGYGNKADVILDIKSRIIRYFNTKG